MRDFLIESGRLHSVGAAMEGLRAAGVQYYWWLGPGEAVPGADGMAWLHGACVLTASTSGRVRLPPD